MFYRKKSVIPKPQGHLSFRDCMLNLGRVFNFPIANIEKHQVWCTQIIIEICSHRVSIENFKQACDDIWFIFPAILNINIHDVLYQAS